MLLFLDVDGLPGPVRRAGLTDADFATLHAWLAAQR